MITYLYWAGVIASAAILFGVCAKTDNWKLGMVVAFVLLAMGWTAYFFRLEQIFVKRYGGTMTIHLKEGLYHIGATWKDDHLWVENYDPKTKTCVFSEYSKGNLLQGKVTIKNCNPILGGQRTSNTSQ